MRWLQQQAYRIRFTARRRWEVDGVIERPLFCCPALWSRTAAARLKLAGRHPGGEI